MKFVEMVSRFSQVSFSIFLEEEREEEQQQQQQSRVLVLVTLKVLLVY